MSKLRSIRKNKRLSQQQLSELSGISQQYISDIETGRNNIEGSLTALRKLANALEVPVTKLIEDNPVNQKGA